jgi:uncharacterized membrane protein
MMGLRANAPGFLVLVLLVPVVAAVWRRWPPPLPRGRRRLALGLRVAVVLLLVLALADVRVYHRPHRRAVVAVVDLSDSARAAHGEAADAIAAMIRAKAPDDEFGVVTFGRDAQVELAPTARPAFGGFQTRPDPTYSDLGAALQLAGNLIPDGFSRQVVLLSDGRQNLGDAVEAVSALRERSVRVDVVELGTRAEGESMVLALDAPAVLRAGQTATVAARLSARQATSGRLTFLQDGQEIEARAVELPAGSSDQTFDLASLDPGTHRLRVVLDADSDGYSQNNVAEAVVRVLGKPSVLLLEGAPGAGANVQLGLEASGMDVQTRQASETPTDLAVLAGFDSIVVADAPAESFPDGALAAIATAVRDLGRGLVTTGGSRSYGPGGWKGTPLEDVLPVRMDPPQPKDKPSVAVILAIETMETPALDTVALGAAEAVVDELGPQDELGIINMDFDQSTPAPPVDRTSLDGSHFVVPLGPVVDKDAVRATLRATRLGDPPGYSRSLALALDALDASNASTKHVVVIGDGDALGDVGVAHASGEDVPRLPDYSAVAGRARAAGVTISSIGVDSHQVPVFMAHMRSIAEAGGGRFYQATTVADVPKLLLAETRSALQPWFQQDGFFPTVTSAGDLLTGVPLDAFPQLGGYVKTTAKADAEVLLASPTDDPVLAATQSGLGRTVAWTSDAAGRWTSALLRSPVAATLFGRMVAWSLPTGGAEEIHVDAEPRGDGIAVEASGPVQGGDVQIRAVSPSGGTTLQQLQPAGEGHWEGVVPAGEVGTYVLHAVLARGGSATAQTELSVPVPYSPEYLDLGVDDVFLRQVAALSGAVLETAASAWRKPTLPLSVSGPVFWLLLLLAVALWPVDVAVRRLTLSLPKLAAVIRAERARRRQGEAALPEGLTRLRAGMQVARQRRTGEAPGVEPAAADATGPGGAGASGQQTAELAARLLEARRRRAGEGQE